MSAERKIGWGKIDVVPLSAATPSRLATHVRGAGRREELLRLLRRDQFERFAARVMTAVDESFGASTTRTDAEIRRRTNLAVDAFLMMRTDCHLSTECALDSLPLALVSALLGVRFEPPKPGRGWGVRPTRLKA